MNKSVTVHIGTTKTGTTALQNYFARSNSEAACYPLVNCLDNSSHWYLSNICSNSLSVGRGFLLDRNKYKNIAQLRDDILSECSKQVIEAKSSNIIFSSECLWSDVAAASDDEIYKYFENLKDFFYEMGILRVQIVIYIRSQISHINSDWIQSLKDKHEHSFDQFLSTHCLKIRRYNYYNFCRVLVEVFSSKNVIVRSYDQLINLKRNIVSDFCSHIQIPFHDATFKTGINSNTSKLYSSAFCELLIALNKIYSDYDYHISRTTSFYHEKIAYLLNVQSMTMHIPTMHQMNLIFNHYYEDNRNLENEFKITLNDFSDDYRKSKTSVSHVDKTELPEYIQQVIDFGSDLATSHYINSAYQNVLGRIPSETEIKNRLDRKTSIGLLFHSLVSSPEFDHIYSKLYSN